MNNVDDMTIGESNKRLDEAGELRKLLGREGPADDDGAGRWQVGKNYFIRTVTHHLMGKLEEVTDKELWLSSVSWIPDDGRFHEFLEKGIASETEVEPAPDGDVAIGRGALLDAYLWPHALLRSVK